MKKILSATLVFAIILHTMRGQEIVTSIGTGTFVEGISDVINNITVLQEIPGTETVNFFVSDVSYQNVYAEYADADGSDGFNWEVDMGQFPPESYVWAQFLDVNGALLDYSNDIPLLILPKPEWLVNGSVENVVVDGSLITFQGSYPIYNGGSAFTIPSDIVGFGGRSLDIIGTLVFEASFDMTNSSSEVYNTKATIEINVLDQLPSFTNEIIFTSNCDLDESLNLSFVVQDEISTDPVSLNIPKIKFPLGGVTVRVDAGTKLYATLQGNLVIGQDQDGEFGFIDDGSGATRIVGVLNGEIFLRGEISVLRGLAKARGTIQGTARLATGFDYVSIPQENLNPLAGGDLSVSGEICYSTFWNLGPSGCLSPASFYYGQFGDTSLTGSQGFNTFNPLFNIKSRTYRDIGTLELPSFDPQPTFSARGEELYAVWLENDENLGYLLFSRLNSLNVEFTPYLVVASNLNSISNPKVCILPSGSAIITWSQNRYDANSIPGEADEEDKLQAQDVWFAIYDVATNSITYSDRLNDDFTNLQSGRAEGKASISAGSDNDAMITWVAQESADNSSDVWYVHLTETADEWILSEPTALIDLPGTNFNVNVVYTDSAQALAVWVNDPDGEEDTYDSDLYFAEWDGNTWSDAQLLSDNDGSSKLNEVSLASNNGYIALTWTSTHFETDNDFQNRIDLAVYDTDLDTWDSNSSFEDVDSIYYFQNPITSISNTGIASICYQVIDMFPDTSFIDNGELYLYAKDLNGTEDWIEIADNTLLCDTNTFIWSLTAGFSGDNNYYTMTQEFGDDGVVSSPENGILFGDPDLSMVLRGISISPDLTSSDIIEPGSVPTGVKNVVSNLNFRMLSNYPNPFNDVTTIEFHLKASASVVLEIFDFKGSKVAELINRDLSSGIYKTIFHAGDLPSGFYYSKLTVDGETGSVKLILNK